MTLHLPHIDLAKGQRTSDPLQVPATPIQGVRGNLKLPQAVVWRTCGRGLFTRGYRRDGEFVAALYPFVMYYAVRVNSTRILNSKGAHVKHYASLQWWMRQLEMEGRTGLDAGWEYNEVDGLWDIRECR